MKSLAFFITGLLLLATPSNAQTWYNDCDSAGTEWAEGNCWAQALDGAESNLDTITELVYYRIDQATYLSQADREAWKQQVTRANNNWISYRNAECYSYRFTSGSSDGDTEISCRASKTEDRIQELISRYELSPEWKRNTAMYTITQNLSIRGLNRIAVNTPLPEYRGDKRGEVRLRIWISPGGRVTSQQLIEREDPELAVAAVEAVRTWRFSPLTANEPQEPQEGVVVFQFGE